MKDITQKHITELGKLWQEEIMNLSSVIPESLDALENRIQDILHRLGKAMTECKLKEWDSSTKKDKCSGGIWYQRYTSVLDHHHLCEEVKVIVSSGYSNDEVMSQFHKFGFKDAISKPYRMREISKILEKVL